MNACSKYSKLQLSAEGESRIDSEFRAAVCRGVFPGASLLICRKGAVFEKTWGTVELEGAEVTKSTFFDLASLTKPLVTAPLCMASMERGLFALDDPLPRFFPGGIPADKEGITVKHLLTHSSGLPPYKTYFFDLIRLPEKDRRGALTSMILETPLDAPPGQTANYSDPGFLLLGLILEKLWGERLDKIAQQVLFDPLGIEELHFCPIDEPAFGPASGERSGAATHPASSGFSYAATQICPWRKRLLIGEVDDENAWTLNGVAGHAGLFGTTRGVFSLLSFLWDVHEGKISDPLWPRDLVRLFWTRTGTKGGLNDWCLGYDTPSRKSSSAGRYFSRNTVGHLGFTGVSFWLDLEKHVMVILLTNRVHPTRENDEIRQLRPVLHDTVMEALGYGN